MVAAARVTVTVALAVATPSRRPCSCAHDPYSLWGQAGLMISRLRNKHFHHGREQAHLPQVVGEAGDGEED